MPARAMGRMLDCGFTVMTTTSDAFRNFVTEVKGLRRPSEGKGYLLLGERGTGKQVEDGQIFPYTREAN